MKNRALAAPAMPPAPAMPGDAPRPRRAHFPRRRFRGGLLFCKVPAETWWVSMISAARGGGRIGGFSGYFRPAIILGPFATMSGFPFDGSPARIAVDALQACIFARWSPTIGDASLMGWVTVGAYLFAAATALWVRSAGAFKLATARRERAFWAGLCLLMLFLAVNKQLDLQSFLTAAGRCVAKLQGWYAERRAVQIGFVAGLALTGVALGVWLTWWLRGTWPRTALALLGVTLVFSFVMVRAVGFHHVDALINFRVGALKMNWVLELSGLGAIVLAAFVHPTNAQVMAEHRAERRRERRGRRSEDGARRRRRSARPPEDPPEDLPEDPSDDAPGRGGAADDGRAERLPVHGLKREAP